MEITKEDLASMSPEQIAALQKQNCIFCHIISGKVSSKKIFEDDQCIAILDINPANPGHVLVVPKEHYTILPLLPEDLVQHMGQVAKHISQACLRVLKAQGTNIFIANGAIAGQKAPHFMIHIIPRRDNDDVGTFVLRGTKADDGELLSLREKLAAAAAEIMKVKPPEMKQTAESEPVPEKKAEVKMPFEERKPLPKINIDQLADAILTKPALTQPPVQTEAKSEGQFMASTQSNKVHAINCPLAKKIKRENLMKFGSVKEALDEGYEECDCVR